jgi:hypothetical protein
MIYIAMLKYHSGLANWNTVSAVGAFVRKYDKSAIFSPSDSIFRASLHAFATL